MEEKKKTIKKDTIKKDTTKKETIKKDTKKTETKKDTQKALTKTNKKLSIKVNNPNKEEIEKIGKEIEKQKAKVSEKLSKVNTRIFENLLLAIIMVIYFIMINVGFNTVEQSVFYIDLRMASMALIISTIIVFEIAYKKDSGKYAIHGIEMMFLSICTLFTESIYKLYNDKFIYIMGTFSFLFGIYYVGKSIVIYLKMKKSVSKISTDVNKITKVEE